MRQTNLEYPTLEQNFDSIKESKTDKPFIAKAHPVKADPNTLYWLEGDLYIVNPEGVAKRVKLEDL